jgi:hypothetical protein
MGGLVAAPARAHEVPLRVAAVVHVAPAPGRVELLVRVPLDAMRDVEFPRRGAGALDLRAAGPALREAAQLWVIDALRLTARGRPLGAPTLLGVRALPPADRRFDALASARAAVADTAIAWPDDLPVEQGALAVHLAWTVPAAVPIGELALTPTFARLGVRTTTVLHVHTGTATRLLTLEGDPGAIALDPDWRDAAGRFLRLGVIHILGGLDHLLFLACLLLPVRRLRPIVAIVTAFTIAHSITLVAAALGLAPTAPWFAPLVEVGIALSVVGMAVENVLGARLERRWMLGFAFGLVHGFGFAAQLGEALPLAGRQLVAALAAFNVGVEVGQLAVLALAVPALAWALRAGLPERATVVVASAVVGHEAWHWMGERWAAVQAAPMSVPAFDAAFALAVVRLALVACLALGAARLLGLLFARWSGTVGSRRPAQAMLEGT